MAWLCHKKSNEFNCTFWAGCEFIWSTFIMSLSILFLPVLQITKTTMRTCPTPKWTLTNGVRRRGRRSASHWRSSLMSWRNITATNYSSQTETSFQLEVSTVTVCVYMLVHLQYVRATYCIGVWGHYSCLCTVVAAVFGIFVTLCVSPGRTTPQHCEFFKI